MELTLQRPRISNPASIKNHRSIAEAESWQIDGTGTPLDLSIDQAVQSVKGDLEQAIQASLDM